MKILEIESQFTSGVYTKRPIALVRGKGARVWDSDENEYVDCVGGQGSVNIGHANPVVAEAIAKQAQTLVTCPEMFYNDRRAELEAKLTSITGLPRVFLCNSGTEAVEAAIKFARLATKRTGIVAAMRGFHGRTFGALSDIPRAFRTAGAGFQSHLLQRCRVIRRGGRSQDRGSVAGSGTG
jgi:acetylornithine/LysW-gamma-L-lysine aminotransferase